MTMLMIIMITIIITQSIAFRMERCCECIAVPTPRPNIGNRPNERYGKMGFPPQAGGNNLIFDSTKSENFYHFSSRTITAMHKPFLVVGYENIVNNNRNKKIRDKMYYH